MNLMEEYEYDQLYNPNLNPINNRLHIEADNILDIYSKILDLNRNTIDFELLAKVNYNLAENVIPAIQDTNFCMDLANIHNEDNYEILKQLEPLTKIIDSPITDIYDKKEFEKYNDNNFKKEFQHDRMPGKYLSLALKHGAYSLSTWMRLNWGTIAVSNNSYFLENNDLVFITNVYDGSQYIKKITEKLQEENITNYKLTLKSGPSLLSENPVTYHYDGQTGEMSKTEYTNYKTKYDIPLEKIIISEKIAGRNPNHDEILDIMLRKFNVDAIIAKNFQAELATYNHLFTTYGKTMADQLYYRLKLYTFLLRAHTK